MLLRDLDVALYWTAQARLGIYQVDALLGCLAGVPTYSLMVELALNRTVHGRLPAVGEYPTCAFADRRAPVVQHADLQLDSRMDAR